MDHFDWSRIAEEESAAAFETQFGKQMLSQISEELRRAIAAEETFQEFRARIEPLLSASPR